MRAYLVRSAAILGTLALVACAAEDAQTSQQDIDHDITVSHQAGSSATLDNISQAGFAPWRFTNQRPP